MKALRPHRFPPLTQLTHGALSAGVGAPSNHAQLQNSLADGFQEGLNKGYQEGFESGQAHGHQAGLAAGYEEGRQQGRDAARREALAQFDGLTTPLDRAVDALQRLQADYQSALRKEVVELVAKVARQVIRCELALQPTQLLSLVDEALAVMPPTPDGVDIYLNPEECQRIRELAPERAGRWNLIADPRLEPGECRVHAGDREADVGCRQRLSACMSQVREHLLDNANEADSTAQGTDVMEVATS